MSELISATLVLFLCMSFACVCACECMLACGLVCGVRKYLRVKVQVCMIHPVLLLTTRVAAPSQLFGYYFSGGGALSHFLLLCEQQVVLRNFVIAVGFFVCLFVCGVCAFKF